MTLASQFNTIQSLKPQYNISEAPPSPQCSQNPNVEDPDLEVNEIQSS